MHLAIYSVLYRHCSQPFDRESRVYITSKDIFSTAPFTSHSVIDQISTPVRSTSMISGRNGPAVGTVNYTLVSVFAPGDVIPRVGIAAEVGNMREIRLAELHAVAV